MRKTVHLIATEDAGWLLPLFSETIVRWSRKRLADFGLDRRRQDRALALVHRAVDEDGPLTRRELGRRLARAGFETESQYRVHLWLLATLDGDLCLGPDRGAEACLVRTADWIGEPEPRPREDALAELARRYLRGYAPADERDLARWAGLPLRDARAGFERIAAELRPVGELFALERPPRAARSPVVRMLGAFDNYNLGYVDRGFAIAPSFEKQVNPGGGMVRPGDRGRRVVRRDLVVEAVGPEARGDDRAVRAARGRGRDAIEAEVEGHRARRGPRRRYYPRR